MLSAGALDFTFHSRLVALEKSEVVTGDQIWRDFQFALSGAPQDFRRLREAIEQPIMQSQSVREWVVRIQPEGRLGRLNSLFILARAQRAPARHNGESYLVPRIGLRPQFERLKFPLQIARHLPVIEKKDPEPFPVADAIPELIGFAGVLGSQIGLAHVRVRER